MKAEELMDLLESKRFIDSDRIDQMRMLEVWIDNRYLGSYTQGHEDGYANGWEEGYEAGCGDGLE